VLTQSSTGKTISISVEQEACASKSTYLSFRFEVYPVGSGRNNTMIKGSISATHISTGKVYKIDFENMAHDHTVTQLLEKGGTYRLEFNGTLYTKCSSTDPYIAAIENYIESIGQTTMSVEIPEGETREYRVIVESPCD